MNLGFVCTSVTFTTQTANACIPWTPCYFWKKRCYSVNDKVLHNFGNMSQQAFTCAKSITETIEKRLKYVQL